MAPKKKEVTNVIKLQVVGGQANPAPPIGPVLGQAGINIMEFCKQFNARTQKQNGEVLPVVLTVYKDRSFDFICKTSPASFLLLKALKGKKGSGVPNKEKIGKLSRNDVLEIAKVKLADLNTDNLESAYRSIKGTARSMGIDVVE